MSRDFTFLVAAGIERTLDFQTGLGCGRSDQLDHGKAICHRSAAPILRNVTEHPVLDLVPLFDGLGRSNAALWKQTAQTLLRLAPPGAFPASSNRDYRSWPLFNGAKAAAASDQCLLFRPPLSR
jgi:hypothetical protein